MARWDTNMTEEQLEIRRERARQWSRDNPKRTQSNTTASRKRHPDRRSAQNAVYNAIKRGDLVRQSCEVCGEAKSQAHHVDKRLTDDDQRRLLELGWHIQDDCWSTYV